VLQSGEGASQRTLVEAKINFKSKGLLASFVKMPQVVSKELRKELKTQLVDVQRKARREHRFTTRSGDLERSVDNPDVSKSGLSGEISLNTNIAPYARRIHEGGKNKLDSLGRRMTNKADPFLHDAFEAKQKDIEGGLQDAIGRAIRKAGF